MLSTLSTLVILGPDGNTRHSNVAEAVKHYGCLAYPFTPEKLWRYYGKNFFYPLKLLNIFYVDLNKTFKLLTIFDVDTLAAQNLITKTQLTFDQALFALPVTQHENLINALSRVQKFTGEVEILWTSTVEHLIWELREWAQMELRHVLV
ncbi:hypothetical protein F2Q69_00013321 [Brassica cretica]|uniref:Uncharacterized protein n=1 Tax=Brassica cretica TaxID=69181 RepID=A0A8S9QSQ2_BRACR|nr:hypothetical protein F2Q69_00013321 [Brassica cretica]